VALPAAEVAVRASLSAAARDGGLALRELAADGLVDLAGLAASRLGRGITVSIDTLLPAYVGEAAARPNRNRVAVSGVSE
jgi:hypothetical protein